MGKREKERVSMSSLACLVVVSSITTTLAWSGGGGGGSSVKLSCRGMPKNIVDLSQRQRRRQGPPQPQRQEWHSPRNDYSLLMQSSSSWSSWSSSSSSSIDWSMDGCPSEIIHGETLLRVHFDWKEEENDTTSSSLEDALQNVSLYLQSFPFARVLPVQPIMYGGNPQHLEERVELSFLRKKTLEKGMIEGGIDFSVSSHPPNRIELTAKRNAHGQTVSKLWSEKMVIQALVNCLTNKANAIPTARSVGESLSVLSLVHKWM